MPARPSTDRPDDPPHERIDDRPFANGPDGAAAPSKSQRKRDMHALQDLGEQLTGLSPARLDRLPLPENLREAIDMAARMKRGEAQRRQLQYLGRLMRSVDAGPIREALASLEIEDRARARAATRAAAGRAGGRS